MHNWKKSWFEATEHELRFFGKQPNATTQTPVSLV
jgi:hypothetical protein